MSESRFPFYLFLVGVGAMLVIAFLLYSKSIREIEKEEAVLKVHPALAACTEGTFDPKDNWSTKACWHPQQVIEMTSSGLAICRCIKEGVVDAGVPEVQEAEYDAGEDWQ